jgi:hypothetical protein
MLDLLRDAYNHSWTVVLNDELEPGRKGSIAVSRVRTRQLNLGEPSQTPLGFVR